MNFFHFYIVFFFQVITQLKINYIFYSKRRMRILTFFSFNNTSDLCVAFLRTDSFSEFDMGFFSGWWHSLAYRHFTKYTLFNGSQLPSLRSWHIRKIWELSSDQTHRDGNIFSFSIFLFCETTVRDLTLAKISFHINLIAQWKFDRFLRCKETNMSIAFNLR